MSYTALLEIETHRPDILCFRAHSTQKGRVWWKVQNHRLTLNGRIHCSFLGEYQDRLFNNMQ